MGNEVNPKNMNLFKSWPTPLTLSIIRRLLGLAGSYRRSVNKFFLIASSLTTLNQRKAKFIWYKAGEKSFQE